MLLIFNEVLKMADFATVDDVISLFRALSTDETAKATALLPVVSDLLRQEALNRGKDLDAMITAGEILENTVKSVTVDIVARSLMTSTSQEPMTQMSQSAGGYSMSGTFLSPGGGIFVKRSELSRLGLTRQRMGGIEIYETRGDCDD